MDEFLQKMGELFECVLFTASLAKVCSHTVQQTKAHSNVAVEKCLNLMFVCLVPSVC